MKTTITEYQFIDAFRATRPDNFSNVGLSALFEYLEEYEQSTDEEIELDVIGLCCDYCESDYEEIRDNYDIPVELSEDDDDYMDSLRKAVIEWLEYRTDVVYSDDDIVVYRQAF